MPKALYFPGTVVTDEVILKNALLLWDSLETIVPTKNWEPRQSKAGKVVNEAIELIVGKRAPTDSERTDAHKNLNAMAKADQLLPLVAKSPMVWREQEYLIYPEKFGGETWRMLEEGKLAEFMPGNADYRVPPALGYLMMSLLADSCAGTQVQKIADQVDAYSWLRNVRANTLGSPVVTGLDVSQVAPAYDRLISISLNVLDARAIPLERLVAFRKREQGHAGADYRAMRQRYALSLNGHIQRVTSQAKSVADVQELERQFKEELKHDLADLKAELNAASLKALFSKEVAISAAIVGGAFLNPIAGLTALSGNLGLIGVIPLAKSMIELRGARRTALLKHNNSWLYLGTSHTLQLR